MKLYKVEYLSSCTVNKRLTNPMIPWIIAEIKKNNYHKKVSVIFLCQRDYLLGTKFGMQYVLNTLLFIDYFQF